MDVYVDIESMSNRIIRGESKKIAALIQLYSQGVKTKLRNAEFALTMLRNLAGQSDDSIYIPGFTVLDSIHFYIDSFFAFLYSSFDVIAQIINQKLNMAIDEQQVSFKRVKSKLDQNYQGTILQQICFKLLATTFFINLERYRNCSTHRRQIYIESKTTTRSGTPGYSVSGPLTIIERLLCDNPLILKPKLSQKKELIIYCSKMLKRAKIEIDKIAKTL